MPSTYSLTRLQHEAAALSEAAMLAEDDEEREAVLSELDALLDKMGDSVPDKLDSIRAVNLRLSSLSKEARAESQRLAARAKSLANHADRVKGLARTLLEGNRALYGEAKVRTSTANYRLQRAGRPRVVAPSDEAWTAMGWVVHPPARPDKTAALKALQAMETLPDGWSLEHTESVRW